MYEREVSYLAEHINTLNKVSIDFQRHEIRIPPALFRQIFVRLSS